MPSSIFVDRMANLAAGLRANLRNHLTLGAHIPLGMWQWTLMDGSTWAAVGYDGTRMLADGLQGWAGFSQELDLKPVIGVYVAPEHRGQRLAHRLVSSLVIDLLARDIVQPGETIFATTSRWPAYYDILESHGVECAEWE